MLTIHQVTTTLRQQLPYLSAEYGITRLGVFGSYAKGTQQEQSDIDLLVEFKTPLGLWFVELTDYLEQLLQRPVDVLTPAGISTIRNPQVARDIVSVRRPMPSNHLMSIIVGMRLPYKPNSLTVTRRKKRR